MSAFALRAALAAALLAAATPVPADELPIQTDGGASLVLSEPPAVLHDSPAVKALLAANPGRTLIICLAGCRPDRQPSVVFQRTQMFAAVAAVEAGGISVETTGVPVAQSSDAIICIAGCDGPVGIVVWRGMRFAWVKPEAGESLQQAGIFSGGGSALPAGSRQWVAEGARKGLLAGIERSRLIAGLAQSAQSISRVAVLPIAQASPRG